MVNINSIRNKFELLSINLKGSIDTLLITATKTDHNFPDSQLTIEDYSESFRCDGNHQGDKAFLSSVEKTYLVIH